MLQIDSMLIVSRFSNSGKNFVCSLVNLCIYQNRTSSDYRAVCGELLILGKTVIRHTQVLESGTQAAPAVAELVKRVDLRKNGMEISMNLVSLLPPNSVVSRAPLLEFTQFVPLQLRRRGVAMRLVIGGGLSTRKTDPTLLKAVARGHKWFNELVSGQAAFTREIAARWLRGGDSPNQRRLGGRSSLHDG
jgi:hypothetical protein